MTESQRRSTVRQASVVFAIYVIRPLSVVVAVAGLIQLYREDWLLAGALILAWVIVSIVGWNLLHGEYGLGDASPKLMFAVWLAFIVVALRGPLHWCVAVPVSWLGSFLVVIIPQTVVSLIVELRNR
jgi:hypothetical protein